MISLQDLYPEGTYLDFKDKDTNDWQVGLVLKINQNSIKVRTQGWPSKYDQLIFDINNRIKPFRSIVRGYTGQQKNPAVRQHWKFTLQDHKQRLQMIKLFNSQQKVDQLKWIQFIRGEHYLYIDFLLSQTYANQQQLQNMYNYFKQHIILTICYLQEFRTEYQQWFDQNQKQKGQRQAYYQIFDGAYLLTANSMRHSNFKKNNSALINTVYPNATHQHLIAKMIKEEELDLKVVKIINLLISQKYTKLPVPFVYAIFKLFLAIEKSLVQRDEGGKQEHNANKMKRKKIILSLFELIKREVNELVPFDVKSSQNQKQLQSLLSQIVPLFFKYGIQKSIFEWIAKSRLKCDILLLGTDSLQRKLKGINKLKEHLQSAIVKNEYALCKLTIESYVEVFRQENVSQVIFVENEHPQIIKKGVDLWMLLYKQKAVNFQDLLKIWKNCIGKHQAIRKAIFQFWIDLIPFVKQQIEQLIQTFITKMNHSDCLNQQWQITMFCNFIIKILELKYCDVPAEPLKPLTYTSIIEAGYNKLFLMKDNQQFQNLVMQYAKAITQGQYANGLIKQCFINLGRGNNVRFNALFLTKIYSETSNKDIFIAGNSLAIIISRLQKYPQSSASIFKLLSQICNFCIRQKELQMFGQVEFELLWKLSQTDKQIKSQFFKWILSERGSVCHQNAVYELNSTLDQNLKINIFKNYLCNFAKIDYINLSLEEFNIFRQFLIEVNRLQNKIQSIRLPTIIRIIRVKQAQIVGLKFIWDIFLNCKNQQVLNSLNKLIIILYLQSHPTVPIELRRTRIVNLMTKIQKNLKDGYRKGNTRIIMSTIRLLKILINVIKYRNTAQTQKLTKFSYKYTHKIKHNNGILDIQATLSSSYNQIYKKIAQKLGTQVSNIVLLNNKKQQIGYEFGNIPFCFNIEKQMQVKILSNESNTLKEVAVFIKNKLQSIFIDIIQDSQASQQAYSVLQQFQFDEKVEQLIQKIQNTIKAQPKKSQTMQLNQIYLRLLQSKIVFSILQKGFDNKALLVNLVNKNIEILGSPLHIPIMNRLVGFATRILFSFFKNQLKIQTEQQKSEFSHELVVSKCIKQIEFICIVVNQVINSTEQQNLQRTKIFFNCFNLIQLLKGPLTLQYLLTHQQFPQIMKNIYINKCSTELRLICTQKLKKIIKTINQQQHIYQIICDNLSVIFFKDLYPEVSEKDKNQPFNKANFYYYNLVSFIIAKLSTVHFEQYVVDCGLLNIIKNKIEIFNDNTKEYQCNYALRGNLDLLAAIYQKKLQLLKKQQIPFFLQGCLELTQNSLPFATPKCYHQQSVKSCFQVLISGSKDSVQKILVITKHLKEYHLQDHWRNQYSWDAKIDKQARQKYRGLQNPGCICYMNSFIQQLFMNKRFRNELLNVQSDNKDKEQSSLQLIKQLKRLFLQLIYSQEESLDSVPFSKTIKGYDNKPMIKIFVQMDIDEFSNIFFDRFQQSLFKLGHNNFVKSMYGGVYSHQIISTQCVHTSEREEQFMTVSLQVKSSLNESLQALVRPQILDGENKYFCERCDRKVRAQKIQTIKTPPQYLIVALKRFEYNFQIDAKVKLNDFCQFSQEIDLTKYSQQYIMSQKSKKGQNKQNLNQNENSEYKYKLSGVVVHSGSAQNGHYYSLIQDQQGKWLQFNDGKVEQFDVKQLGEVAFGSKNNEDKVKNAYLLFYQKIPNIQHQQNQMVNIEQKIQAKEQNQRVINSIDKQNKIIQIYKLFFSGQYRQFVQKIWQNFNKNNTTQQQKAQFQQYLINYFLTIAIREQNSKYVIRFGTNLKKLLTQSSFSRKMLLQIMKSRLMLAELFVYCFNRKKCKIIQTLLRIAFIAELQSGEFSSNHKEVLKSIIQLAILSGNINQLSKFVSKILSYCRQNAKKDIITFIVQSRLPFYVLSNIVGYTFSKAEKQKMILDYQARINAYKIDGKINPEGRKCIGSELIQSWRFISQLSHYFKMHQIKSQTDVLKGVLEKYLKQGTFSRIIYEATTSKTVYYLYQTLKNLQLVQQSLFSIQKGLKDFQSIKYRPLLLLIQYIICDKMISQQLCDKVITMIQYVINVNQKYFLQVNLVIQWIDRIIAFSSHFQKSLLKNEGLIFKIVDWIQRHKMSSAELVKKHKNVHNPRNFNKINGIVVSADPKQYQNNSLQLIKKFQSLCQENLSEKISPNWNRQYHQELKPGNTIRYYYNMQNKWKGGQVVSVDFGSVQIKMKDKTDSIQVNQQQQILRPEWAYLEQNLLAQKSEQISIPVRQIKSNTIQEQDLYS